jgi:hypothetical protein
VVVVVMGKSEVEVEAVVGFTSLGEFHQPCISRAVPSILKSFTHSQQPCHSVCDQFRVELCSLMIDFSV